LGSGETEEHGEASMRRNVPLAGFVRKSARIRVLRRSAARL